MKTIILLSVAVCLVIATVIAESNSKQQPWMNKNLDPKNRARALMNQMTAEEKKGMLYGYGCQSKEWPYVGNVAAIPRLNIPSLKYNDGPQGFRDDAIPGSTTAWQVAQVQRENRSWCCLARKSG